MSRRLRAIEEALAQAAKLARDSVDRVSVHEAVCVQRYEGLTNDIKGLKNAIRFANTLLITTLLTIAGFFLKQKLGL